jgi:cytochrome bd-type quinol oxidase subunit 2
MRTKGEQHARVWKRLPHLAWCLLGVGILPSALLWALAGPFWAKEWLSVWVWVAGIWSLVALMLLVLLLVSEKLADHLEPGWRDEPIDDP